MAALRARAPGRGGDTPCGFNRFMDAIFGTGWRSTVPHRKQRNILRRWNAGLEFVGRSWDNLRRELRGTSRV